LFCQQLWRAFWLWLCYPHLVNLPESNLDLKSCHQLTLLLLCGVLFRLFGLFAINGSSGKALGTLFRHTGLFAVQAIGESARIGVQARWLICH